MAVEPWFLHVDLDAFFASVEQLDHPAYRGKPLIVGGLPTDPRSVVSTASYEARKYGVHSAMPTAKAYKLCPHGIYVHGNMKRYEEMSYQIMQIFKRYSPDVMQMSIDEAFIDLTGTERLFGPPEETAMEIKRVVKEETGLTVSIGLSRSKYFAKISSGLNKPDGFYFMKPGTESDFMLRQPIDKIWGIGGKTAKRIFDSGIKTTKQLYEKSLDVLTFMYGESTGTFLYNIIRGNADGMFDGDVKSHSISNERTFPIDVTDIYTNETALLELAHSVMFRLLRDNLSSRTVVIKIRYEDFTTVSIRQTYSSDILTLDSFYEKAKELFEKKYEVGRGVRLLGIGFDNVKTESSTYQQDLFDDGEKKKQAVEQAILKIEKKFPDIHVQKARTVKSNVKPSLKTKLVLALFLLLGFFIKQPIAYSEENQNKIDANAESLFGFDINDSNVEFLASGFWNVEFTGSAIMAFNGGKPFSISFGVPVFKQEVNLSTWIMINKKWYFEADFADEFKKNTVTLGYIGNGLIKSAMISNRNIVYPSYYSSNIFGYNPGGGENQSPGFSMHLENEKLFADFMIRYDMQKTQSATFYGYNSVTDAEIRLNDYITGRFFVIPSGFVTKIKSVYVENNSGSFSDKNGRRYKKLSSSQYFILPSKSTLILSEDAGSSKNETELPSVIITFTNSSDAESFIKSIGSYADEKSFLGKIQKYFNSSSSKNFLPEIPLQNYSYKLESEIENETAIVIQSPEGFSPFLIASNYDLGLQSDADVYIYSKSDDKPNSEYLIEETRDTLLFSEPDFWGEKHNYGTVFTKSYDLKNDGFEPDFENDISLRFPLASSNPMIYLNTSYESDLRILLRMYSPISAIQINSGVSAGCVRVYKNGILDASAKYDSTTGIITLSSTVSDTDKIYVTWENESDDILNGKLTAGAGIGYLFTPTLKGDLDFTVSVPLSPFTKFANSDSVQNGYGAITSGIYYENENLSLSDAVSFSMESENITGSIIVLESSSNIPETFYLSSTDGYESKSIPNLNRDSGKLELENENKANPGNLNGITDQRISGYKIPIEVDFKNISDDKIAWTSADIKLSNGNLLLNGDTFNFALKQENISDDYDVYLQLGVYATTTGIKISDENIPTWKLTEKSSDVQKPLNLDSAADGNWQTVSVKLSDSDRARFSAYHDARIIVVSKKGSTRSKSGFIYAGPYETETIAFETFGSKGVSIKSSSSLDNTSPSANKFSKEHNYVNKVEWTSDSEMAEANFRFGNFFSKTDYSNYEKIKFNYKMYYKTPENPKNSGKCNTFTFILDSNTSSIKDDDGIPSVKVVLNSDFVTQNDENWHSFEINVNESCVYIDGAKIECEELYINNLVAPSAMKIEIDGIENGEFHFDTLYYDEISPFLKAQNYFATSYKKEGDFISIGDTAVLSDFEVNFNSRQSGSISTSSKNTNGLVQGFIESGITVTNVRITADTSLSSSNKKVIDNAGHSISTVTPIFDIISFNENHRFNPIENSVEKKDSASINIGRFLVPLTINGNANAKDSAISKSQDFGGDILFSSKYILFDAGTNFNQKINVIKFPEKQIDAKNYFVSYAESTVSQFSSGDENASMRANEMKTSLTGKIPFAKLSPKLSYRINGEYNSLAETTYNGNQTFGFEIPFSIRNLSINLAWKKQGAQLDSILNGGSYKSDLEKTFSDAGNMDYFFKSIIFYDLFEDDLRKKLYQKNIASNSQSQNYITNYSITWNRKLFNSMKDLYIPLNAGFEVERNIKATDTISDFHQYKASVGNSFINLFGANSSRKLFSWYNQDEFTSSAECAIKVPYDDKSNITYTISLYSQLIFYITNSENLKTASDILIETSGDWSFRGTAIYSRLGKKAPLLSLVELMYKGNRNLNEKISRKEIFNMELSSSENEFLQKYEIGHNCEINFLKNYTLSTGINLAYSYFKTKADTLAFNLTIGGKMEF